MAKLEITEEMLDAIEAVKGKRDPVYWDGRCKRYLEKQNEEFFEEIDKKIHNNLLEEVNKHLPNTHNRF